MSIHTRRSLAGLLLALVAVLILSGLGINKQKSAQSSPAGTSTAGLAQSGPKRAGLPGDPAPAALGQAQQVAPSQTTTTLPVGPAPMTLVKHDTSPALRDITPIKPSHRSEAPENETQGVFAPSKTLRDPILQNYFGRVTMPAPIQSFDGVGNVSGVAPPDTEGDVGPSNYVQWINDAFQIWDKNGNSLYGPADGNTLWAGFGGPCETTNDGDPVVLYDPMADRWLLTQFAVRDSSAGYWECLAVSQTPDPTGAYFRYGYRLSSTVFNDYPKLGVWPDGYYMSMDLFENNQRTGAAAYVFERSQMLVGGQARIYGITLPNMPDMLPSDLDGTRLPAAGEPNFFASLNPFVNPGQLNLYRFHVDWSNPNASTWTGPFPLNPAPFNPQMCADPRNGCIPQPGVAQRLDAITDRLMFRLAYRNFGDHESLVVNHTVNADGTGRAGVRWYEIRNPNGAPVIYQQGTYSPDGNNRWLGSVAMDQNGDMGLGYSVSSPSVFPSVRYTGRLVSDPLGTMPQGEASMVEGTGSQTTPYRWGDYSAMSVDPSDDCTFWFTEEYVADTGDFSWATRIGSFKFASCGPPPSQCPGERFLDVCPSDYFYQPVIYLNDRGVISGYADHTFRPFNNTTRGQLAKIVVLAYQMPIYSPPAPTFTDVPVNSPFYQYVETAYHNNIVSGYSCGAGCLEFRPGNNVTRGQLSKFVVVAANQFSGWQIINPPTPSFVDVPPSNAFYAYVETAVCHGIISGYADHTFRWGNNATRGQISKIVYLAVLNQGSCGGSTPVPTNTPPTGATATRTPTTPAGSTATRTPTTPAGSTPTNTPTATAGATGTPCTALNYAVTPTAVPYVNAQTLVPGSSCDDCTVQVALPFTYHFYSGTAYNSVTVSSNGNLQFNSNNSSATSICLPTDTLNQAILPFWDDLDLSNTSTCQGCGVYTQVSGSAPNRVFTIEWYGVMWLTGDPVDVEVDFVEGSSAFFVLYRQPGDGGFTASAGVQKDTGSLFTQYECQTGGLTANLGLLYYQPTCPSSAPDPRLIQALNQLPKQTHGKGTK